MVETPPARRRPSPTCWTWPPPHRHRVGLARDHAPPPSASPATGGRCGAARDRGRRADLDRRLDPGRRPRAAALRLLDRADRPTAVFTANNFMTHGALQAAASSACASPGPRPGRVRRPRLDDPGGAAADSRLPAGVRLGRVAGEPLLARIGGEDAPPQPNPAEPPAIVRGSCGGCHARRDGAAGTTGAADSTNPTLEPGGAGEAEVAGILAEPLRGAGLEVDVWEAAPGHGGRGRSAGWHGGGRSLMFWAMPLSWTAARTSSSRCGGTAGCMVADEPYKGGIAAALVAVERLARASGRRELLLPWVIDEEGRPPRRGPGRAPPRRRGGASGAERMEGVLPMAALSGTTWSARPSRPAVSRSRARTASRLAASS